ncbi:hypothetical protein WMY93_022825 [Mugilogobius chulae]|uniref:Uncharacterized protein n=1 Tax=Mugilogobius chulae TaxID=88201 RepID=A0AAW0NB48_9GOBI
MPHMDLLKMPVAGVEPRLTLPGGGDIYASGWRNSQLVTGLHQQPFTLEEMYSDAQWNYTSFWRWEETGVIEKTYSDTGRTCKLHSERSRWLGECIPEVEREREKERESNSRGREESIDRLQMQFERCRKSFWRKCAKKIAETCPECLCS